MKSRLRLADLLPVSTVGLRTRPGRAALSVLGVAIGIAAMVSVLGITRSSQADLLARIDRLGTNLLTVANGKALDGAETRLPATAGGAAARTDGVLNAAPTAELASVRVYRTDQMPANRTGGLTVRACDAALLATLDGNMAAGRFLDSAIVRYPATVLGFDAARALGIGDVAGRPQVYLGGHWFTVVGILRPVELAPEVDSSALIGFPIAADAFGYDGHPPRSTCER
ncbi:hypothetical protein HDA40_000678 [Hamadaea flava]|nr:hypothetical protein [Hamadaea flava]